MTSRLRRLAGALLAGLLTAGLVATSSAPASAITGGRNDTTGRYPNVGLIAFYDSTGSRYRCSATLVSPTVLLTAAHCTEGTVGLTAVTFQAAIADTGPSPLPAAANPSVGYTAADLTGTFGPNATSYVGGTASTHPAYSGFTDLRNWNDVGVVVLSQPYTLAEPVALAPVGTLDAMAQKTFTKTLFTFVGYGTEVRQATTGPRKPTPLSYPLRRQYVEAPGQKLTAQVFQTNGNDHDPFGGGGTCFGDSGGPALFQGRIVGVTSYGYTSNCRFLDGYQRVDIPVVREWLATFGL